jgi:hypothetical protein
MFTPAEVVLQNSPLFIASKDTSAMAEFAAERS